MAKIVYNAISVTSKGFEVVKIGTTLIVQGAAKRTYGLRKDVRTDG